MIDKISVRFENKSQIYETLMNKGIIKRYKSVSVDTGEVCSEDGSMENLYFSVTKSKITFSNSLQGYYNATIGNGAINYNDFTYKQITEALNSLGSSLNYDLRETSITALEFHITIQTDLDPSYMIDNNIFMYKKESPLYQTRNTPTKMYKQFGNGLRKLKIYDKTKEAHYNMKKRRLEIIEPIKENLLRFEVAYDSVDIKRIGIRNLAQLYDKKYLRFLYVDLLQNIELTTILDKLPKKGISEDDKKTYWMYTNPLYWKSLSNPNYQKNNFETLIAKYKLDGVKRQLLNTIENKYNYLINN